MKTATLQHKLASTVRILRAEHGWSQETLALLANLHRNYIGHVERSEVNIGLENLAKLSSAFNMSTGDLLNLCEGKAIEHVKENKHE